MKSDILWVYDYVVSNDNDSFKGGFYNNLLEKNVYPGRELTNLQVISYSR